MYRSYSFLFYKDINFLQEKDIKDNNIFKMQNDMHYDKVGI